MNMMFSYFIILVLFGIDLAFGAHRLPQVRKAKPISETEKRINREMSGNLHGGRPIKPGELRPSVYIGNCTATIVGPQTLLTAGHCRRSGQSASFTLDRTRYTGRCVRHPQYSMNGWLNNDFALCKFSPKIDLEVYGSLKPNPMKVGDPVTMQGYGKGSNGRLNVGETVISRVNYMDLITSGSVRLGGGDSGGALFKRLDDTYKGPFVIVGVNSRGDNFGRSYFNRTSLERSQKFFEDFAKRYSVEICGINSKCEPPSEDDCESERLALEKATQDLMECKENAS